MILSTLKWWNVLSNSVHCVAGRLPRASLCDAAVKGGSVLEEVFSFIYKDVFDGYKKQKSAQKKKNATG